MNPEDLRRKAIDLLSSAANAYKEAIDHNHDDRAAQAIFLSYLNEYEKLTMSKEYIDSSRDPDEPPFEMSAETMKEFKELARESPLHADCKITDAQVKALVEGTTKSQNNFKLLSINECEAEFKRLLEEQEKKVIARSLMANSSEKKNENLNIMPTTSTSSITERPKKIAVRRMETKAKSIEQQSELQPVSTKIEQPPQQKSMLDHFEESFSKKKTPTPQTDPKRTSDTMPSDVPPPVQKQSNLRSTKPNEASSSASFRSASKELQLRQALEASKRGSDYHPVKSLGCFSRNPAPAKFKVPLDQPETSKTLEPIEIDEEMSNPILKGIDAELLQMIKNEIVDHKKEVLWNDIAGLRDAKTAIHEAVVMPLLRPDLFEGLRSVPKGILLFGPPGTGKTLIGKCIASQVKATFFSISSSTLTSKWIGQGEKLVKALFMYAKVKQPAVVFIDEIDSILTKRSEGEHESSRRLKTEFLIQLDGATTGDDDRVLLVAATNRPQELDDAARRRFTKRLYIPLPDFEGRLELIEKLLQKNKNSLTTDEIDSIAEQTDGYSGADLKVLCSDAAMNPLRELSPSQIMQVSKENLRLIHYGDFTKCLKNVKASVSQEDIEGYVEWNLRFGSTA